MSFKDLLVHLDDSKACDKRIEAALAFAEKHGARVDGVFCIAEYAIPAYGLAAVPPAIIDEQRVRQREKGEEIVEAFRNAARKAGVQGDARLVELENADVSGELALHGRHYDLVIMGQDDPEERRTSYAADVVLSVGRPVLFVPYTGLSRRNGDLRLPGRRILVAWDAGREATRAVHDALPLLKQAEQVIVLSVNPRRRGAAHGESPGTDLAAHLTRHGARVEVDRLTSRDLDPADALLARISDEGCDLLVMGAYGHTRLREIILGGVTETIFDHMTVPVLMSH